MTPGERFKGWIDGLAEAWKERLRGWMSSWLTFGIEVFFDILGKAAAPKLTPFIERLERETTIPPELKPIFDEIKNPQGEIAAIFAQSAGGALVGGAFGKVLDYILRPIVFGLSFSPEFVILDPVQQISLWMRGVITNAELEAALRKNGFGSENMQYLKDLVSPRLTPELAIRAQFRGILSLEAMQRQLKDQGWRGEDITALWEASHFYPLPQDLIRWQAREVFEPEMIERYGLDSEFGAIDKEPFYKAGMTDEQILNYWRAHWEHATWQQVVEMLHRGLMTEEEVSDWFRVVEIPPFWRDKLIGSAYTWPTRVDVRRWWDMRTIDETELRRLYSGMGYRGANLDNYLLWTKVYVAFPDLMARWQKGWITIDDVRSELVRLGMPAARVEEMIQTKVKPAGPERVTSERDLTKTDIIKGVKKEVITWGEGIELLQDLGYDEDEADYILTINIAALEGSPETMEEFRDITQKYRKAVGLPSKPVTEELIKAGAEVVRLTKEVESLREAVKAEEKGLIDVEPLPAEATEKRDELRVALHRAEAELSRVQTDYNALVAQWRQTEEK